MGIGKGIVVGHVLTWNGSAWVSQAGSGGGGGADPNASYIVVGVTGSLPNERSLFATNGIIGVDGGAGNPYGISIDDSVVATLSGSTFTGNVHFSGSVSDFTATGSVKFNSGLSGSLTRLTDDTSYLVAGTGISITSASNGQVTIINDGTVGDITSVIAGTGLSGGGTSGDVTLDINDSTVATVSGTLFTGNIGVPNLYSSGVVTASLGLSGSLTRLVDGSSYLIAGTGVTLASASNGSVTISAPDVGDITSVTAGTGLTGGGTTGAVTLNIDDSVIATISGSAFTGNVSVPNLYSSGVVTASLGLSGSLTKLTNSTSYLVAGTGISIASASNGQVTITNDGTVGDITSVTAGTGLTGGGTSGNITLDIDDSVVATVSGTTFTGNIISPNLYAIGSVTGSTLFATTNVTSSYAELGIGSIASTGEVRLPNNSAIVARNSTDTQDVSLISLDSNDDMHIGDGATNPDNMTLDVASTAIFRIAGGYKLAILSTYLDVVLPSIIFRDSTSNPTLKQGDSTSATKGETLAIQAQTSTAGSSTGGNLSLAAGAGTINNGDIQLSGSIISLTGSIKTDGNNSITLDANATSNFTVDGAHLQLKSTGAGSSVIAWAESASGTDYSYLLQYPTGNSYMSASVAQYINTPALNIGTEKPMATVDINTTGAITLDSSTGGISLDAGAASNLSTTAGALPLDGAGGINIGTASDVAIDMNASTLDIDTSGAISIDQSAGGGAWQVQGGGDLSLSTKHAGNYALINFQEWGGIYVSGSYQVAIDAPRVHMGTLVPITQMTMTGSGAGSLWDTTGWHTASFGASRFELFGTDGVFLKGGAQSSAGLSDGFIVASGSSEVTTFLSNFSAGSQSIIGAINSAYSAGGGGGTGADPNASYIVVAATASLPNERSLFATNGIIAADGGAGNPYGISIDDSVVATVSGSTFTGAVNFNSGLSGSLTQLTDGTSYLKAGNNVTITSASNGAITVNATTEYSPDETLYSFVRHLSGSGSPATASFAPYTFGAAIWPLQPRTMLGIRYWNLISSPAAFTASLWESGGGSRVATGAHIAATSSEIQDIMFNTPYVFDDGKVGKEHRITILRGDTGNNPYATSKTLIPATPFIADVYLQDSFNLFNNGDAYPTLGASSQYYILEPIWQKITQ